MTLPTSLFNTPMLAAIATHAGPYADSVNDGTVVVSSRAEGINSPMDDERLFNLVSVIKAHMSQAFSVSDIHANFPVDSSPEYEGCRAVVARRAEEEEEEGYELTPEMVEEEIRAHLEKCLNIPPITLEWADKNHILSLRALSAGETEVTITVRKSGSTEQPTCIVPLGIDELMSSWDNDANNVWENFTNPKAKKVNGVYPQNRRWAVAGLGYIIWTVVHVDKDNDFAVATYDNKNTTSYDELDFLKNA